MRFWLRPSRCLANVASKRGQSELIPPRTVMKRTEPDSPSMALPPVAKQRLADTLSYPITSTPVTRKPPLFQKPTPLLTFSYSPTPRQLTWSDASMKYYVDPPHGAELGYGYKDWVRRPEEKGRIDTLCEAWSRIRDDVDKKGEKLEVGVVCWRGVMTKILTSPYEEREGWELNVMNVNGTLYFEEQQNDERLAQRNDMKPHHRKQTYYGYAFESYCTSSTPTRAPGWGGMVDTSEQWASVVKTKLGDTRILIGGEVDCVRGEYNGSTENFVELKTSLTIRNAEDEVRFEKKLLKFYFQSFLLGVPEIIVGFRTPAGRLSDLRRFKTMELARLVRGKRGEWDPSICLAWADDFLRFVREFTSESDSDDAVWRVKFEPGAGAKIRKLEDEEVLEVVHDEDRVGFLPGEYYRREKQVVR